MTNDDRTSHLLAATAWPDGSGATLNPFVVVDVQVWVDYVAATLQDATAAGARIVTPAIPFWAETTIGRMVDPWENLWWLFSPALGQSDPLAPWEGGDSTVFDTIDAEMRSRASR